MISAFTCFSTICINSCNAEELSFLNQNQKLKSILLQWENEAPDDIVKEIKILRDRDSVEKAYAARRLKAKGPGAKGATLALIETFSDDTGLKESSLALYSTTSPAREAVESLTVIGKVAVNPLIASMKDKAWQVRYYSAQTLGSIKDPKAVEPLIAALKDSAVAGQASSALSLIGQPAVQPLISVLMNENDGKVKISAIQALRGIKDPKAVEPLILALKDKDWKVRNAAVYTLEDIKDSRAVEPLIASLKDEESVVRINACEALGEIKDPKAVEPLAIALKDSSNSVRKAAAEALKKITGKNYGEQGKEQ